MLPHGPPCEMTTRRPIFAANWKMNKTIGESIAFVTRLKSETALLQKGDVVVAPPFTALAGACEAAAGSAIGLAAQNLYWEEKGAFTGEISAGMVADTGCRYVIIGHSERRSLFGETDATVNRKLGAALQKGLIPIFCLGETLQERQAGRTFDVVGRQLDLGMNGLESEQAGEMILAYEPVWAIGTGQTATPDQASEVHGFVRSRLRDRFGGAADRIRIQYGGSVTPENAKDLMAQPEIDGALIGGASLKIESFLDILHKGFQAKGVLS